MTNSPRPWQYASSALSGQSLCRNLAAFSFPLFTTQMYNGLGYQVRSLTLGGGVRGSHCAEASPFVSPALDC